MTQQKKEKLKDVTSNVTSYKTCKYFAKSI